MEGLQMDTLTALRERKTVRGFLDKDIPKPLIQEILLDAHWAPSASNQQPWHFHVVTGNTLCTLNENIKAARKKKQKTYDPSKGKTIPPEYVERTKTLFRELRPLISSLGDENRSFIESGSYRFYDAPAVLLLSMHQDLPSNRLLDIGMAAQNCMLSAHARGLGTCAIALTLLYAEIIQETLAIEKDLTPVLSIALGYPDPEFPINNYRSPRDNLEKFVSWKD